MKPYDYLIVGAGFFGATFAYLATQAGRRCLVIDKRSHIGGNAYCKDVDGIHVHFYGAHIFHTRNKQVWDLVNSLATFNRYTNSPIANYKGRLYNLPFNMNTFYQLWGVRTPQEAKAKIDEQRQEMAGREPQNLEEQAISLVGRDIYELAGSEVQLDTDFLQNREKLSELATTVVYSGAIDAYFDYSLGHLDWRTLRFEHERLDIPDYQGNAVMNFTDAETPYTRIIEHKHFEFGQQPFTVISREYSSEWTEGAEPFYTVNDERNNLLAEKYREMAQQQPDTIFGGRLAEYKYYDMDQAMSRAIECWDTIKQ